MEQGKQIAENYVEKVSQKDKYRLKLVEYIGNPYNDFPTRKQMSTDVLGHKLDNQIYQMFSPAELDAVEAEGFELKKQRSVPHRSKVYDALFKKAKSGDVGAIKEYLERLEGKIPNKNQNQTEHSGDINMTLRTIVDSIDGKTQGLPNE